MRFGLMRNMALLLAWACSGAVVFAGGTGHNVLVVVNQQSSNSVALGNFYCETRKVPPDNLFRMSNWAGGNVSWSLQQFTNTLLNPLLAAIKARGLTNQADFLLLSMDIPYKVEQGDHINSTTAALYYGFKTNAPIPIQGIPDSCSLPSGSINSFAGTESPFRSIGPGALSWTNMLTTMITASNLALAKLSVSLGEAADASFPSQSAYLVKSPSDTARNIRYRTVDDAVFDARVQALRPLIRTNRDNGLPPVPAMSGAQTGWQNYNPFVTTFAPGALVDNLTSYGGTIFEPAPHLKLIDLLRAGATGAYGTVVEPCAYLEKFPTPHVFFYQSRGFSLAECYYMGLTNPYQGLILGDPLAAPFALGPTGFWTNTPVTPVSGTVSLDLRAFASQNPVGRVDLYVDGLWLRTLTNIPPRAVNSVEVSINGVLTGYQVPNNASLNNVALGLASLLNGKTAQTRTHATAIGDRLELRYLDRGIPGAPIPVTATGTQGGASLATTHAIAAQPAFLDTAAHGIRSYAVTGDPTNRWLRISFIKTNGVTVSVAVTNTTSLTLHGLCQALASAINSHPDLSGPDGVVAEDVVNLGSKVEFNVRARAIGWDAAQIRSDASSQSGLTISPAAQVTLEENLADLQPRNHIYITSGLTNLSMTAALDTTTLPNGPRELTAVLVEGSNAQAQRRVSTNLFVQNGALTGSLQVVPDTASASLDATLQFNVSGNGEPITKVELYSTGGLIGSSTQPSAGFAIPADFLGVGLHPFYGIVTSSSGKQFRTASKWIRIEPAIQLTASKDPHMISWPATPGQTYTILSTTNLANPFEPAGTITASNSVVEWPVANPAAPARFYRVRSGS